MAKEDKKSLDSDALKNVSGGMGGEVRCTYCNSAKTNFVYDHDEICFFDCQACGRRFSIRY
ncbi:MAG: hypothetical protein J6Z43_07160 [Clostridiales bacterium]|nr:hypothetical protein [Clostridiales bacterium]